ncbi:unnamed protein product [Acanthoscelides obtectus]|uniref:EF-hand domain-containing protein n=1 Tax=Acanthoscelides obtectus TaxID=200917 RepID=A0A9P0M918_ACAOB|nr:unnamed protein product [Acanthoscelides obtectus]CAK1621621.1 Troponin C, isoform 1 [Acanthoscelides obtectus]
MPRVPPWIKIPSYGSVVKPVTMDDLDREQLSMLKSTFDVFDVDRKGYIEADMIGTVMDMLGTHVSADELDKIITEIDEDSNGEINFEEFANLAARFLVEDDEDTEAIQVELKGAFRLYDKEVRGYQEAAGESCYSFALEYSEGRFGAQATLPPRTPRLNIFFLRKSKGGFSPLPLGKSRLITNVSDPISEVLVQKTSPPLLIYLRYLPLETNIFLDTRKNNGPKDYTDGAKSGSMLWRQPTYEVEQTRMENIEN